MSNRKKQREYQQRVRFFNYCRNLNAWSRMIYGKVSEEAKALSRQLNELMD